ARDRLATGLVPRFPRGDRDIARHRREAHAGEPRRAGAGRQARRLVRRGRAAGFAVPISLGGTMAKEGYERGMKTRRKVLGDEWVDRAERNKNDFNAEFQELLTRYAWDEIWNRPGLDHRTRRMLVLAMTAAIGRWEEFKLHSRAALEK